MQQITPMEVGIPVVDLDTMHAFYWQRPRL